MYNSAPAPSEVRKTSVAEFQETFSKNILKNLITKETNPIALHKPEKSVVTPVKPLERKEVETALSAQTKTLKEFKKELVDYVKLKHFKVSNSH